MCWLAFDFVRSYQFSPPDEHTAFIEQKSKDRNPFLNCGVGFVDRKSKAVLLSGPGCNHPELIENLGHDHAYMTCIDDLFDCCHDRFMSRVVRICESDQDIGVEQDPHSPRPA